MTNCIFFQKPVLITKNGLICMVSKAIASINAHFSKYWTTMWLTSENGKALKKILKKPNYLQLYSNIPWHVQTFASRARIGHMVTNTCLYRFNLTESPVCTLCQVEEEDLQHILLGCTSINCHRNTLQSLLPQTSVETLQYIIIYTYVMDYCRTHI